jgi:hypothetical protein
MEIGAISMRNLNIYGNAEGRYGMHFLNYPGLVHNFLTLSLCTIP